LLRCRSKIIIFDFKDHAGHFVSNASHHSQFGEEGKLQPSWLQLYLYVLWMLTMQELLEKLGSVEKLGDWV
jgi:hypothetical protein